MDRNKSKWYIVRMVSYLDFDAFCTTKLIYEERVDKKPEEVKVGDRVVMLGVRNGTEGVVKNIGLYDDGIFKIVVGVRGAIGLLYTTPDRIGILEKGGEE